MLKFGQSALSLKLGNTEICSVLLGEQLVFTRCDGIRETLFCLDAIVAEPIEGIIATEVCVDALTTGDENVPGIVCTASWVDVLCTET